MTRPTPPRKRSKSRDLAAIAKKQSKNWQEIANLDGIVLTAKSPVGQFLERYLVCEAIARKLIADKTGRPCQHTLHFPSIKSAAEILGSGKTPHPQLIENIFRGGDGTRNHKTPRQLRNGIVHGLSREDQDEVIRRLDDLMTLMKRWLIHFL